MASDAQIRLECLLDAPVPLNTGVMIELARGVEVQCVSGKGLEKFAILESRDRAITMIEVDATLIAIEVRRLAAWLLENGTTDGP